MQALWLSEWDWEPVHLPGQQQFCPLTRAMASPAEGPEQKRSKLLAKLLQKSFQSSAKKKLLPLTH